jgi:hypothetical protein
MAFLYLSLLTVVSERQPQNYPTVIITLFEKTDITSDLAVQFGSFGAMVGHGESGVFCNTSICRMNYSSVIDLQYDLYFALYSSIRVNKVLNSHLFDE